MWDHLREPSYRRYGGAGLRHLPLDGRRHDLGADDERTAARERRRRPRQHRHLAVATRAASMRSTSTPSGFFTGFFTSTDGGDNWTQLPNNRSSPSSQSSYGWWFARIWVDPLEPRRTSSSRACRSMESTTAARSWLAEQLRPRRPARDGVGPADRGPRLPRQRRRLLPLRLERREPVDRRPRRSRSRSSTRSTWASRTRPASSAARRTTAASAPTRRAIRQLERLRLRRRARDAHQLREPEHRLRLQPVRSLRPLAERRRLELARSARPSRSGATG